MNVNPSPLFEPVLWDGDGFKILDETLVPEEIHYIQISEVEQALDAVREMKTRAFGQVLAFLYSGALLAQRDTHSDAAALRARTVGGLATPSPTPRFGHAAVWLPGALGGPALVGSYHPSQQNTFTGKLTQAMLRSVLRKAVRLSS